MRYAEYSIAKSFKEAVDNHNKLYELFIVSKKGYKVRRLLCQVNIERDTWANKDKLRIRIYDKLGRVPNGYDTSYVMYLENVNLKDDVMTHHWAGVFTLSRDKAYNLAMTNLRQMIRELRTKEVGIHNTIYVL